MTTAGSQAVNPISAAQHMFGIGTGIAGSAGDPSRYLGPPTGALQTNPYDQVQHANYTYPEAVKDQTLFIKSTIEGFIMEDIEWMTTIALPWAQTEQMNVTWNEWHFSNALADRVPHEGVSRLITSSKRQFKTHVVRRGLAFVMEADYANTATGMEQYARNVMGIGQAVQETQNHDTVYALLTCKNYQKMWQQRFGTLSLSITQIEDNEIETFGSVCLPEGDDRLSKVIEDFKRLMRKQGVVPNMLILWPGATIYMSMVPPMRTEYAKAGPEGVMRREVGPDSLTVFRGLPVWEARDFEVGTEGQTPVQLLTRPVQISEYYSMRFDRRHENASNFETKERAIVLYDENTNQWRKIGFMEAFEYSNLFDENGQYCRKLVELVNIYRARGQRPRRETISADACQDDEMDDADQDDGEAENPPSFFMTTPDNDGEYMLMRYFGQMEMQHATPEDMQRIGETIASNLRGAVAQNAWRDMVRLVNDIEGQTYNPAYWVALVGANTRESVAANGNFVGELTPEDVAEHWGLNGTKQRQWKSNAFGSLRLPQDASMRDVGFPAGFANGPGLQTLAAEARNPVSPWQDVGKRAQKSVELMQFMVDTLRMRLPDSAALDDKGRSPWFHRPDALTTFFETVVSVQRDPLFLASLPAVTGTGLSPEDSMSDAPARAGRRRKELLWFSLPGTVHDIPTGEVVVGDAQAIADAVRGRTADRRGLARRTASGETTAEGRVAFFSPTTMTNVEVNVTDFDRILRFTPEVQAFGMLPGGNTETERRTREAYYNAVADIQDSKVRRKLIDFVYNMGLTKNRATMWRTVYGLHGLTGGELVDAVNEIHLGDGPTANEVAAARARVNILSERAPETANWGGFDVLSKQWESVRPSGTATSGGISFQQSADDVQLVLDLERELMSLSDATSETFSGARALDVDSLDDIIATNGNAARVAEIDRTIRAALGRIGADITGDADNRGAAVRRAGGEPAARVRVTESPSDILDAHYYRTPLTSSLHLVQSLSDMFGQHGVAKPLVLPSDPNTAHTMPYVWDGLTSAATTGGVLGRTNYDPMHISNAIGAAMEAPNYSTIAELLSDGSKRRLDDTGFVKRHEVANFTAKAPISVSSSGGGVVHFDDDDDVDSDNDDIAQVFGGVSISATMSKRARVSAPLIGARESSDGGSPIADALTHRSEHRFTRTGVFSKRWAQANDIADPLVRMCTHVFLMTNCEKETTWKRMIQNDILVPMDFVLWRPLIVHDMASAIMMKGGLETGANLHGGANAAKGNDTVSKLIYYNFTFRSKAVVWKEKNVAIIENLKFEGYVGGMSTGFVTRPSDLDREDQKRPSIIVTAIPINEKPLEKRLDFSGRLQVPETNISIDGPITHQFSSAEYYDNLCYKLSQRVVATDSDHEDFFDRAERISLASYQGTMFGYNRNSGTYSRFTEPQGHLKRNMCYPGAASVLNGTAKAFQQYNYDLVRIE